MIGADAVREQFVGGAITKQELIEKLEKLI
jgi:hypothetical protein